MVPQMFAFQVNVGCVPKKVRYLIVDCSAVIPVFMEYVWTQQLIIKWCVLCASLNNVSVCSCAFM